MKNLLKLSVFFLSASFLLVACSVETQSSTKHAQKKNVTKSNTASKNTYKGHPKVVQSKKPSLSQTALFADTISSHNRIRSKHGLPPLKWSNQLASISQKWANQLGDGKSCKIYHHSGKIPFGENIYRSGAIVWSDGVRKINPVTIKNVVKAWTDEEKWYDYKNNRCQPGKQCGHYTQAVWKGTKEVGCAMKVCADKSQTWVCSYFPAGNIVGARPY